MLPSQLLQVPNLLLSFVVKLYCPTFQLLFFELCLLYTCVLYVSIEPTLFPSSVSMHHHIYFSPPVLCYSHLSHQTKSKILAEAFTLSAFYFPPVPGFESPIFSIIPQTLSQVPHCQCKQDNLMRQSALITDTRTVLWRTINCNMSFIKKKKEKARLSGKILKAQSLWINGRAWIGMWWWIPSSSLHNVLAKLNVCVPLFLLWLSQASS